MRKRLVNKIAVWTFFLCLITQTQAQVDSIRGKIYLEDATPAIHCQVLLEDKSYEPYDAVYSDDSGQFAISRDSKLYQIVVTYLGYKTIKATIEELKEENTFHLEKQAYSIEKVEILAKKKYARIDGDTTTYNFNYYKQQTDHNLGDALNRLSGISVDDQNTILYKNKKIDKLLIEGKDILNDQHKITLENIAPKNVSKIQIIENYRPFHEKYVKRFSEKVAMNILLTEKAKTKINGRLKSGAGYKNKYELHSSAYTANGENGCTAFLKSNNRGDQTVNASDFINIQSSLLRTLNKTKGNINKIIPEALQDKKHQNYDWDNLLALNYESKFNTKNTIKLSNISNYTHRKGGADISRYYFHEAVPLLGAESFDEKLLFNNNVINYKRTIGKTALVEIDIPSKQQFQRQHSSYNSNDAISSSLHQVSDQLSLSPQLFYSKKIDSKNTIKLEYALDADVNKKNITLNSNQNLFGTEDKLIKQKVQKQYTTNYIKTEWQHGTKKWTIGLSTPFSTTSYDHRYSDIRTKRNTELKAKVTTIQPRIELKYRVKKIHFHPAVDYKIVKGYSDKTILDTHFLLPSITARYDIKRLNHFLLKAMTSQNMYNIEHFFDAQELIDNTTLKHHKINSDTNNQRSKTISLSYFWIQPSQSRIHTALSYTTTQNGIVYINELKENHYILKAAIAHKINNLSYTLHYAKKIFSNKVSLRPSASYTQTHIVHTVPIKLDNINVKLDIVTNFNQSYNATLGIKYDHSSQLYNRVKNQFSTLRFSPKISLTRGNFRMHIDAECLYLYARDGHESFYNIGSDLSYTYNNQWTIYLSGKDVLNIGTNYVRGYKATMTYIQSSYYKRYPGSIIMGANYTF